MDLRIAPERLEDAPTPVADQPTPGVWGRADEVDVEASRESVVQLPPEAGLAEPPPPEPSAEQDDPAVVEDTRRPDTFGPQGPSTLPPPKRDAGPPVLASEALRRELSPAEPGLASSRAAICVTSLVGAGLSLYRVGLESQGIAIAVGYLALMAMSLAPMPYAGRATALTTVAGAGVLAATWVRFGLDPDPQALGLMGVVLLLATGLHLRAWHRGSGTARALVALGMGAGVVWLAARGSLSDLSSLDPDFRQSLPRVLQIPFGLLLMVSLLAFMDARTTGGCGAWAAGLWLWYATLMSVELVSQAWTGSGIDWTRVDASQTLALVGIPLLLPTVGMGLAQLIASALSGLVRATTAPRQPHHA